ncbi:MAG TPA: GntR family transcriptional regulator [Bryobacteraceae bacterium]|nr:GntR family transcriptional regulator [Bryobacteraceae bacterium]
MMSAPDFTSSFLNFELDRRSPVPVYIQISDAIRERIEAGELQPDAVLPSSQLLCEKLGITRMTLRQAYAVLEREGLIDAQRGRGTFIRKSRIDRTLSRMIGFSEEMRACGKKPSSRILAFKQTEPSDLASGFLESEVYRIERLRLADREPMAIERVEIAAALCPGLEQFDLAKESLYEVLDREYRVRFTRCEQVVSASIPDARQRQLLHVGADVALLNVTRRSFTNPDRPASCGITQYRGDLYTASVPGERRSVRTRR